MPVVSYVEELMGERLYKSEHRTTMPSMKYSHRIDPDLIG